MITLTLPAKVFIQFAGGELIEAGVVEIPLVVAVVSEPEASS